MKIRETENLMRGFTILELSIIIIIVGILSTIGLVSFVSMIEKSRTAEAKRTLGEIRSSERAYYLNNASYTTAMDLVGQDAPTSCISTHYFSYSISAASDSDFTAVASRCSVAGGKDPTGPDYNITVNADGDWSGTAGYY